MKTLILSLLLFGSVQSLEAGNSMADKDISTLVSQMTSAWNRGDAAAFSKNVQNSVTFTNVNGSTYEGRVAFEDRHRAIFSGPLKGSVTKMTIRKLQMLRSDVAVVNVDCATSGGAIPALESRLLLVLSREGGEWKIEAFHNTAVSETPIVK